MIAASAVADRRPRADGDTLEIEPLDVGFALTDRHIATHPREADGQRRDDARLLVSLGDDTPEHARFRDLAHFVEPGDLFVVNDSGMRNGAIDATLHDGSPVVVHVSTALPGGLWMIEVRTKVGNGSSEPLRLAAHPWTLRIGDQTTIELLHQAAGSQRLWIAVVDDDEELMRTLDTHGRPIRYAYVERDWPLDHYRTVFQTDVGSAEMPSAARPFTDRVVTSLIRRHANFAAITLHTGVSSLEGHERPYPEQFAVSEVTAAAINAAHDLGHRVVAVGTTVVRAVETATDGRGVVHPISGWTDLVVSPARRVRAIDGLVTGWHAPGASHLAMLEAIATREQLVSAYRAAFDAEYLWHEFGDSHLLLPYAGGR